MLDTVHLILLCYTLDVSKTGVVGVTQLIDELDTLRIIVAQVWNVTQHRLVFGHDATTAQNTTVMYFSQKGYSSDDSYCTMSPLAMLIAHMHKLSSVALTSIRTQQPYKANVEDERQNTLTQKDNGYTFSATEATARAEE